MKIYLENIYGIKDGTRVWYREHLGTFSFASDKNLATEVPSGRVEDILKHKDWYLKQFNAESMGAEGKKDMAKLADGGLIVEVRAFCRNGILYQSEYGVGFADVGYYEIIQ